MRFLKRISKHLEYVRVEDLVMLLAVLVLVTILVWSFIAAHNAYVFSRLPDCRTYPW